jgi:acyl carrier protein
MKLQLAGDTGVAALPAQTAQGPRHQVIDRRKGAHSREAIEAWLAAQIASVAGVEPEEIDPRQPFARYGLSSVEAVGIAGDLEDWTGLRLPATLTWDYPNVQALARYLSEELAAAGR